MGQQETHGKHHMCKGQELEGTFTSGQEIGLIPVLVSDGSCCFGYVPADMSRWC